MLLLRVVLNQQPLADYLLITCRSLGVWKWPPLVLYVELALWSELFYLSCLPLKICVIPPWSCLNFSACSLGCFPPNRSTLCFTSFYLSKSCLISTLFRLSMYCFILPSSFVTFERTGARLYPQSSAFSKWLVEMKTLCVTGARSTTWGPNLTHCRLL